MPSGPTTEVLQAIVNNPEVYIELSKDAYVDIK